MAISITQSGFFGWCMDMLRQLEAIRTPLLNAIMSAVTVLGEEMAFIVIGLIIIWCVDKKFGYRFIFMYMLGAAVNQVLKAIFMIPRPWAIDSELTIVESARDGATGFSFPSGHTQSAVLLYGGIASRFKGKASRIAAIVAAVIILLVGFSRMYLGVHTLLDVGVSLITGVIILALVMRRNSDLGENRVKYLICTGIVLLVTVGLVIYIGAVCTKAAPLYYTAQEQAELIASCLKDAWTLLGTTAGLLLGYLIESRYIGFDPKAVWWVQIIKVVIGLAVIIGLRVALKPALAAISSSPAMNGVRYFVLAFVGLTVIPLLFKPLSKLGGKKEA